MGADMHLSMFGRVGGEYTVDGSRVRGASFPGEPPGDFPGDLVGELSAALWGDTWPEDDGDVLEEVGSDGTRGMFLSSFWNCRRIAFGVAGRPITGLFPLRK